MADEKSCIICFEASSKDKDYVTCPYCSFECCKKCLKRFILDGIGEAYCMNVSCKKYFTRRFLGEVFGLNWIARATEGSYKSFIKAKQLEAQKAKLPEIMNYMKEQEELKNRKKQREIASQRSKTLEILIEPYRKLEEDIYKSIVRLLKSRKKYTWGLSATYDREGLAGYGFNHFHDLIMEILKNSESSSVLSEEEEILEGDVTDLKIRKKLSNDVKDILLHPTPALTRKIKDYFKHKDEMDAMSDELESLLVIVGTYDIARYYKREEDKTPVYTYIQGCPSKDCRGLIEKKTFKCSLCDIKICKKCRVEKTSKSEGKEEEGKPSSSKIKHECKKEDLESVALIKSDSKPCPKCATAIFKISGCFGVDTPILLYDGSIKMSQDIKIGDVLIGDDGNKRMVLDVCSGMDELYKITQSNGMEYIVNSKHTLALMDQKNNIVEMIVDDYLNLPISKKEKLYGYKSHCGINYPYQEVALDPYLLGIWLGDGCHTNTCIAANDLEVQKYLVDWCDRNDCVLIHETKFAFFIRLRGNSNGKDKLKIPVGYVSQENCDGCKLKKQDICGARYDINEYKQREKRSDENPFKEQLKKYNLLGNKHIPKEYLLNSREVRLKLLAGLIDSDGCLSNQNKRVIITQTRPNLSEDIIFLARSLGFVVNYRIEERKNISVFGKEPKDYKNLYSINISGKNLSEIPTKIERKICKNSSANRNQIKSRVIVESIGKGKYFGWMIDGNHKFVFPDLTIACNCNQIFCTNCHIAFDWNSGRIDNGTIHNPHYFEFLRNKGISQHDNNVCGDDVPTYTNLHRKLLTPLLGGKALRNRNCWIQYNPIILSRALSMIEELRVQINWMERKNRDSDDALMKVGVRYLTKQIEEHDWERKIYEINEKVSKNNFMIEIYNSLRMILTEAFRKFYVDLGDSIASFLSLSLLEEYVKKRNEILAAFMSYLEEIRKYFNDSIIEEYKKTSLKKGSFNVVGPYWDIMSYTEIQKGLRRPGSFGEESLDDLQHTFADIGFRGRIPGPVMRHLIGSDTMNHTPDDLFSSEESSDEY